MRANGVLILTVLTFLICIAMTAPVNAESFDLQERLELIRASQQLQQEKEGIVDETIRNEIGISFTNYGSSRYMMNPGGRLETYLIFSENLPLKVITEVYYLREREDISSFLSFAVEPYRRAYAGAGVELTDFDNYKVFTGLNITENLFIEAKAVNSGGSLTDSDIYFGAGFKFNLW